MRRLKRQGWRVGAMGLNLDFAPTFQFGHNQVFELASQSALACTMSASGTRKTVTGKGVRVTLTPNPSHLELVNPVVEGFVRARQRQLEVFAGAGVALDEHVVRDRAQAHAGAPQFGPAVRIFVDVPDQRALHAQRGAGADDAFHGLLGNRMAQLDRVVVVAHDRQVLRELDHLHLGVGAFERPEVVEVDVDDREQHIDARRPARCTAQS